MDVISKITMDEITEPVVVIKINKLYKEGMSDLALYEATRGVWKRKIESVQNAKYCLSVFKGTVVEVYKIDEWYVAGTIPMVTRTISKDHCTGRIEFTGTVAEDAVRGKYVGRSVADFFKFGEASPIKLLTPKDSLGMVSDINVPLKPLSIDGNIVTCGRCQYEFEKAQRCPECGQLVDYK